MAKITQQDIDQYLKTGEASPAILPILQQYDPAYQVRSAMGLTQPEGGLLSAKPEQGAGFWGTLREGAENTGRALAGAGNVLTGDGQALAEKAKAQAEPSANPFLRQFYESITKGKEGLGEDPGLLESIGMVGGAIWDNPKGAAYAVLEQVPNAAAVLAPAWAGAKAGAVAGGAAGTVIPGVGNLAGGAIGGVVGGLAGMFLGNTALETGFKGIEAGADGVLTDDERSQVLQEGAVKGAVITGVDALTLGASKFVLGATNRAVEQATRRALVDSGVDVADAAAVQAARQTPEIVQAVQAAQKQAIDTSNRLAPKMARGAAALGLETTGEGLGEYLGELAATGQADLADAVLESFLGLGQSVAEMSWSASRNGAQLARQTLFEKMDGARQQTAEQGGDALAQELAAADAAGLGLGEMKALPAPAAAAPIVVDRQGTAMTQDDAERITLRPGMSFAPAELAQQVEQWDEQARNMRASRDPLRERQATELEALATDGRAALLGYGDFQRGPAKATGLLGVLKERGYTPSSRAGQAQDWYGQQGQQAQAQQPEAASMQVQQAAGQYQLGGQDQAPGAEPSGLYRAMQVGREREQAKVDDFNTQVADIQREQLGADGQPKYTLPAGLELADKEGAGRFLNDTYRSSVDGLVNQLAEGGDVAYVKDDQGRITGRTPSVNPAWWQNMDAKVKPGSVAEAKRIVKKALDGEKLGPKQARFVSAMLDVVDDQRGLQQRNEQAAFQREQLQPEFDKSTAYNRFEYKRGGRRYEVSDEDQADLYDYLVGRVEPFSLDELEPADIDSILRDVIALDDTTEATLEAGRNDDEGETNGYFTRAIPAGGQVPAQQGLPRGGRGAAENGSAVSAAGQQAGRTEGRAESLTPPAAGELPQAQPRPGRKKRHRDDPPVELPDEAYREDGEDDFDLSGYSQGDLQARDTQQARAAQAEAATRKAEADKAQADRDRNDFTLTGSDRPADVAASRGQNDLFGAGQRRDVEDAAHAAATSPTNDLPEPTEAQKEAGNYRKGHVTVQGLDLAIENPRGSERSGKRPDGSEWRHTMSDHYGYIKRTEGADGEQVDVYLGPYTESDRVFVVDQIDQQSGAFDEHKVMLGFNSKPQATAAYRRNFDADWQLGPVTELSMEQFKEWLGSGDLSKPLGNLATDKNAAGNEAKAAKLERQAKEAYLRYHNGSRGPDGVLRRLNRDEALQTERDRLEWARLLLEADRLRGQDVTIQESNYKLQKERFEEQERSYSQPADAAPEGWRDNLIKARKYANEIGVPHKGKTLEQLVAEIDGYLGQESADPEVNRPDGRKRIAFEPGQPASDYLADGATIEDGSGQQYRVHYQRNDLVVAHPIIDGKAQVNAESGERFHIGDPARADGRRTDPIYRVKAKPTTEEVKAAKDARKMQRPVMESQAFDAVSGVGEIIASQTRHRDGEYGVSWASTDIATAGSMKEAAAIAKAVAESGAETIEEMREAAKAYSTQAKKPAKPAKAKAAKAKPLPKSYGADNKLVTADRAEELRKKLLAKLGQVNSGIDPELVAIGTELAVFHIEAGARKFMDMARALSDHLGVPMQSLRPYLRSWYNGARDMMEDTGHSVADMDDASTVRAQLAAMDALAADTLETNNDESAADESGADGSVEQDRADADAGDRVGNRSVSDDAPAAREGAGTAGREDGKRGVQQFGDRRLSDDGAFAGREPGDSGVRGEQSRSGDSAAGSADSGRGAAVRGERVADGREGRQGAAGAVEQARSHDSSLEQKRAAQRKAAKLPVKVGDLENIRASLPFLLDLQQEDVHKTEQRFLAPEGYGMLLTNGTGTGKTYSGSGTIARSVYQGRDNVLVIAPSAVQQEWLTALDNLGVSAKLLASVKDNGGSGVVVTTHENAGQNDSLVNRQWDLVVVDESHKLLENLQGDPTLALKTLRAVTMHPRGAYTRARQLRADDYARLKELRSQIDANSKMLNAQEGVDTDGLRDTNKRLEAEHKRLADELRAHEERVAADVQGAQGAERTRTLFLSATPFASHFALDYAEGYLFSYGPAKEGPLSYNEPGAREGFFVANFGYRMRYNKLTRPDAEVNTAVMEVEFNERLKREGAVSGRALVSDRDYSRDFILIDDAVGAKIDEGIEWLREQAKDSPGYSALYEELQKQFDYLTRMRLLEAIKVRHALPIIQKHLAMGRKVYVMHDYIDGGGFHPFRFVSARSIEVAGEQIDLAEVIRDFNKARPDLVSLDLSQLQSPLAVLSAAFGDKLLQYNGRQSRQYLEEAKRAFNRDGGDQNVMLIQRQKGKAGISLHDTTGKHQRVMIDLGIPGRATDAIQGEGRGYRVGVQSDLPILYMTTATSFENFAFAHKTAERSGTAENLGMGSLARGLRDSILAAYQSPIEGYEPHDGEGKGGKARDRELAVANALSPFERSKTFYYGQQKNAKRRDQREGADYFATPEPVGFKMVEWAGLQPGEPVLEPSAGHGAIARFFPESAKRVLIEPSMRLASKAGLSAPGAEVINDDFESHHVVNKYAAIVMNPPYGMGGKTAAEHVAKAIKHLRDGGRVVALIPEGPSADKRFEKLLEETPGIYQVGSISLPRVTFERAGTQVKTRVLILEKQETEAGRDQLQPSRDVDLSSAESINELFDRLENISMRDRVLPAAPERAEAPAQEKPVKQSYAEKAAAEVEKYVTDAPIIEHTTAKGKVLRGVIVRDMSLDQIKEKLDKYAFKKDGGVFVRQEYIKRPDADSRYSLRSSEIDQFIDRVTNTRNPRMSHVVGETPAVFELLGEKKLPVQLRSGVVLKALGGKHELSADQLKQALAQLNDPVMVFDSNTEAGAMVALTEVRDNAGRAVVVALHFEQQVAHHTLHDIATVHGRNSDQHMIHWIRQGLLAYRNKKTSRSWLQSVPLQLRWEGVRNDQRGRVYTESDLSATGSGYRLTYGAEPAMPPFRVKALGQKLRAAGLPVEVVASEAQLPADLQEQIRRDGASGRVEGTYHNGVAYLVASNLASDKRAMEVALHEVVGHGGVRSVLGERIEGVMAQVYRDMPADLRQAIEADYAGQLAGLTKTQAEQVVAEEYLAHLAETDPRNSLVAKVISMLRNWLRQVFGDKLAMQWTRSDLVELLAAARRAVAGGAGPNGGGRYSTKRDERREQVRAMPVPTESGAPAYLSESGVMLYGKRQIRVPESEAENTELKMGHVAHIEPGMDLWHLDAFVGNRKAATLTVQIDPETGRIAAIHDIQAISRGRGDGEQVVAAILAASDAPVRIIEAVPEAQDFWSKMGANGYFDPYNNTEIGWYDYTRNRAAGAGSQRNSGRSGGVGSSVRQERAGVSQKPGGAEGTGRTAQAESADLPELDSESLDYLNDPSKWTLYSLTPSNAELEKYRKLGLAGSEARSLAEKIRGVFEGDWRAQLSELGKRTTEGLFDGLAGIKAAEEAVGVTDVDQSGYVSARLASGLADVMHGVLHYGAPEWKDGIIQPRENTRGLLDVLGDLGADQLTDWLGWLGGKRAQLLMRQGRENNLSAAEIDELLALAKGREQLFERTYQEYAKLNDAVLDLAQEAGLIGADARQKWLTDYYVPFYRSTDGEGLFGAPRTKRGLSHQSAAIKALRGGEVPTNDLLENILTAWSKRIDASMKNKALLEVVDNLKESDFLTDESVRYTQAIIPRSEIAKRVKADRKTLAAVAGMLGMQEGASAIAVAGELMKPENEGFEKLWALTAPTDPDIIRVQRDGKNEYYRVNDPALLRSVKAMAGSQFNDPVTRIGRWFKRLLTTGVTASPDFIARNFVRDAAHAWIINKDGFTFGVDSIKGLAQAVKEDPDYQALMFAGASFQGGYVHGTDPEASAQIIRRALEKKGLSAGQRDAYMRSLLTTPAHLGGALNRGWQKYRELGDKVENANRLSTYKAALAAGKSKRQAAFEAKDLMDYSLRGNFAAMVWFTDVVPFLNARLQGLYKLGRAMKGDRTLIAKEVAVKGLYLALFSLLLAGLNDDDERYKALAEWDKDANWHIFLGDEHYRIPKPFELGLLFGTVPERMLHLASGSQDLEQFGWSMRHGITGTLAFNPVPQFYNPLREVQANRNFFFDKPIESMADEGKLAEARYDEYTSLTMRALGKLTGPMADLSPKQLQHLWEGYTGTLGAYALWAADQLVAPFHGDRGERPSTDASDLPVLRAFYRGDRPRSTQYHTDLYDMMGEVEQLARTVKSYQAEGLLDQAESLAKESRDKLRHRRALGLARQQLGAIRKRMQAIHRSTAMTGEQKRAELDRLQLRSNELAKRIVDRVKGDF